MIFQLVHTNAFARNGIENERIARDANTKSILEILLHIRQIVRHRLPPVFAGNKIWNILQRPRPVQGIHGDEVVEFVGFQVAQVFLHPGAFKLEGAVGFAFLVEFVCFFVVERDIVDTDFDAVVLLDQDERIPNNGEGFEAQKVHFDNPGILDDGTFVLRNEQFRFF